MGIDNRTVEDRSLDYFPHFTLAKDDKGISADDLPRGSFGISISKQIEIRPDETVTFTLRATDPKGRPMKLDMYDGYGGHQVHDINQDEDLTLTWQPIPEKLRQLVTFYLRGDYEGMHRNDSSDQTVAFRYVTFPSS